jgi:hypothetical protein
VSHSLSWCYGFPRLLLQLAGLAFLAMSMIFTAAQTVFFAICALKAVRSMTGPDFITVIISAIVLLTSFIGMVCAGAKFNTQDWVELFGTSNRAYAYGFGSFAVVVAAGLLALAVTLKMTSSAAGSSNERLKAGAFGQAYTASAPAGTTVITVPSGATAVGYNAVPQAASYQS